MNRADRQFLKLVSKIERARRKRKRPSVPGITAKQRAFIDAYLWKTKGNATEAARLVGYKWPGKVGPALVHHPLVNRVLHA
ncbi:hypothetical protein [Paludisphaera soli]|uniref:hypothetical protein n=1 Tax=Paludisphaera soli TaxID=2712865 RepID=UPI0013EA1CBF|nr:hypothetical protein [Paludisphaera soli]